MLNVAVVASSSLIFASGHKQSSSCMDLSQAEQLSHASVTKLTELSYLSMYLTYLLSWEIKRFWHHSRQQYQSTYIRFIIMNESECQFYVNLIIETNFIFICKLY